jgi:hypothetical protein
MDQRSEIEHFVIEAIQDITNSKNDDSYTEDPSPFDPHQNPEDARDQDSIPDSDTPNPNPNPQSQKGVPIHGSSTYQHPKASQVNKKIFTWDDREKVLRVIFGK